MAGTRPKLGSHWPTARSQSLQIQTLDAAASAVWRRSLIAAIRQTQSESVAEAVTVLRQLLRAKDDKLKSIVGRALLALREKPAPEEQPVALDAIEELARLTQYLATHDEKQIDRMLDAGDGEKKSC